MNKIGWLVNDKLTCIPGTKTLWHDLLQWLPGLVDMTDDSIPFDRLGASIRDKWLQTSIEHRPDYIIRNGTFFGPLNLYGPPVISLIQDVMPQGFLRNQQHSVAAESASLVFNSEFTKDQYPELQHFKHCTIPLGVDFNFFDGGWPPVSLASDILPDSVLFVGAANNYPKGFDRVQHLIKRTSYNFCLVLKDGHHIDHPRVRVFNNVDQKTMRTIYNHCKVLICTSRMETQHLAGIEAAACGLPIIATNVGIYSSPGNWGFQIDQSTPEHKLIDHFEAALSIVFREGIVTPLSPRTSMLQCNYDKESCAQRWQKIVYECTHSHH